MPVLVDPDQILPDKKKRPAVSQIVAWLLYPVIFLIGVTVGIVVGVKQAPEIRNELNANRKFSNASIVSNVANSNRANTNSARNANGNTNNSLLNTNIFRSGDSAKLDAATAARLEAEKQSDLDKLVDNTADFIDILRQKELIGMKYNLSAYHAVRGEYPSTDGAQIRLERDSQDVLYAAMKEFYGGSFYEPIDPQSPDYYYGYTSDGATYTLSAYLTSKKKSFVIRSQDLE